jgi:hypothetical protein
MESSCIVSTLDLDVLSEIKNTALEVRFFLLITHIPKITLSKLAALHSVKDRQLSNMYN